MSDFMTAYAPLKRFEGGWCNNPDDRGGETYAGIARRFFPRWPGWSLIDAAKGHSSFRQGRGPFSRHLAGIPALEEAVTEFYRVEWWERLGLARLPQAVADEIFEQAVNLGRGGAGKLVQRLCNAFNYDRRTGAALCADLAEDGAIGPKTLAALSDVLERRADSSAVVHALNALQAAHYIGLAARTTAQRQFVDGWMQRTYDPA